MALFFFSLFFFPNKELALISCRMVRKATCKVVLKKTLLSGIGFFISFLRLTFLWWLSHVYQPAAFLVPWVIKSTNTKQRKRIGTTPVPETQGCASVPPCPACVSTTGPEDLATCPRKKALKCIFCEKSISGNFHCWLDLFCCFT